MRHGETASNLEQRLQGVLDVDLNEEGKRQAREALDSLPPGITMIISSPLKRAKQTAEIVAKHLGLPIIFRDELKEKNYGSLAGKTFDEVSDLHGIDARARNKTNTYDYREFGGESAKDINDKIIKLLRELNELHPQQEIILITHAGIIRAMHHLFSENKEVKIGNATIHEFNIESEKIVLMNPDSQS